MNEHLSRVMQSTDLDISQNNHPERVLCKSAMKELNESDKSFHYSFIRLQVSGFGNKIGV